MTAKPAQLPYFYKNIHKRWIFTFIFILWLNLALFPTPVGQVRAQAMTPANPAYNNQVFLPIIVQPEEPASTTVGQAITEEAFAAKVEDGEAGVVKGVFVQDVMALKVEQQPENNPGYVSFQPGTATQFSMAEAFGVIGLLAHDTLSGSLFFELAPGNRVSIIYGDGTRAYYRVTAIEQYQALQPYSLTSDFVDLKTGKMLTAGQLFDRVYTGGDQVTFQTCFPKDGISTWGRYFVIAEPV